MKILKYGIALVMMIFAPGPVLMIVGVIGMGSLIGNLLERRTRTKKIEG